jgi:hypothetical protein
MSETLFGLPLHAVPNNINTIITSHLSLKKIAIGHVKLGEFFSMIQFDSSAGVAARKDLVAAFNDAAKKNEEIEKKMKGWIEE